MQFQKQSHANTLLIEERLENTWRVGQTDFNRPFMIMGEQANAWACTKLGDLTAASHLLGLCPGTPELILIGAAGAITDLPAACMAELQQQRIGIEVMSLDAAARTFNLLAQDGRQVAGFFLLTQ